MPAFYASQNIPRISLASSQAADPEGPNAAGVSLTLSNQKNFSPIASAETSEARVFIPSEPFVSS